MKRYIALFLVFSMLTLPIPLTSKERKGADLIIRKTDGTLERGELIAVKENSVLLLDRESGTDVTVDINDIYLITIVKKSKFLKGAGLGFLIGAGIGILIPAGYSVFDDLGEDPELAYFGLGVLGGALGLFFGALGGLAAGTDKIIQFEGKSDSEIQEILAKLRKKARIRNAH
jgi:hypothetical protein